MFIWLCLICVNFLGLQHSKSPCGQRYVYVPKLPLIVQGKGSSLRIGMLSQLSVNGHWKKVNILMKSNVVEVHLWSIRIWKGSVVFTTERSSLGPRENAAVEYVTRMRKSVLAYGRPKCQPTTLKKMFGLHTLVGSYPWEEPTGHPWINHYKCKWLCIEVFYMIIL